MTKKLKQEPIREVSASCQICENSIYSTGPSHMECTLSHRETFAEKCCEYFVVCNKYKNFKIINESIKTKPVKTKGFSQTVVVNKKESESPITIAVVLVFGLSCFLFGFLLNW